MRMNGMVECYGGKERCRPGLSCLAFSHTTHAGCVYGKRRTSSVTFTAARGNNHIATSPMLSEPIFNGLLPSDGTNIYHTVDIFP